NYWSGRRVHSEETGSSQRETGAHRGRKIEETESVNEGLTRRLCGSGALPRGTGRSPSPHIHNFKVFRYSRNSPPRSSRFNANSTVALRKPSLSPVSWRRPS